jgi:asparagine synthase (glutamine-hydrolysing)
LNEDYIYEYYSKDEIKSIYPNTSLLNKDLYNDLFYSSLPIQLNKADKSAMANSVECRFPFLDYRLVEYAFSLPYYLKINNGISKFILREALKSLLPKVIYKRKDKVGFAVPQNKWLKNELKDFILNTISEEDINNSFLLNRKEFNSSLNKFYNDEIVFDSKLCTIFTTFILLNKFKKC